MTDKLDQCGKCIMKGNMGGCLATDCSHHDTWYAKEMTKSLDEAYTLISKVAERFNEISKQGTLNEKIVMVTIAQCEMEEFLISKGRKVR